MKKKLLAALLVLVMLLSVMPLAAYAEDEDSSEAGEEVLEEVQQDADGSEESQTAETPASETPSSEDTPSLTSVNDDGDDGDDEDIDPVEEDDTPEEVIDEPVAVSEDETENSSDTECPYPNFEEDWAEVVANCKSGTHTDYFNNETKIMIGDGLCDVCGYHDVKGKVHIADEQEITETTHGFHCKYDGCDYEWSEEHTMKWTFTNASGHSGYCTWCWYTVSNEAHTFDENGVCTACGYEKCTDHVVGTEGYQKHICKICGELVTSCVDTDGDCKCDICGGDAHGGDLKYTETEHWLYCYTCGQDVLKSEHYDRNEDGICDFCGYGCSHESIEWTDIYSGHSGFCTICGHYMGWEYHDQNEPCEICGYVPCTTHTYDTTKTGWERHQCTVCKYVEDCTDTNGDCVCEVCGEECHYLYDTADSLHYDSDEHWFTCGNCGKEYYRGTHSDNYNNETLASGSDGLCDVCGYAMNGSGSSADDSGLDDVPKTGDASLALAGLSVLFAACPILKKFVI